VERINFRRILIASGLIVLVIIYAVLWLKMITSRAESTGTDFISSYSAARIAQRWGAANVYDQELERRIQADVVGFALAQGQVLMFNHPPYLVPMLVLIVNGSYAASMIRYVAIMIALYLACAAFIVWLLQQAAWKQRDNLLLLAGFLTFYPLFVSLLNAQDTAVLVLGAFLWLAGLLTGKDWLAGVGLALTSVRPHITILLAVPFVFRRQKVFGWFSLAIGSLAVVSLIVLGPNGVKTYLQVLLIAAGGNWYGMNEPAMINLVGLLWRILPGLGANLIHAIGWIVYGGTLVGLCILWMRSRVIAEKQVALAIALTIFTVPHLHYHDLTLLVVALVAGLMLLVREGYLRPREAALAPLVLSFGFLFASLVPVLKNNAAYLVMILLILIVWMPGKFISPVQQNKPII